MQLIDYIKQFGSSEARERFATAVGSTVGHLRNVGYGYRPCDPKLAMGIERESCGAVTRQELRPNDAHLIWPDIKAPKQKKAA
jgi:DNA-binding transcriptional regulator YdaS (Cro superfamily)